MVVFSSFEFHFLKSSPFGLIVYFFLIRIRKPKIRNFDNSASKNTRLSNRLSERIWFHNPCWRRHLVTSSEVWKNMISHTWCTHHNIWYITRLWCEIFISAPKVTWQVKFVMTSAFFYIWRHQKSDKNDNIIFGM